MSKDYRPAPASTEGIKLPGELEELTEAMARNVHEVWAQTRIEQGWTYGKERNDTLKQHPGLVAYDELPESERLYDRRTALETLRFIYQQGFEITKKQQ